MVHHAQDPGQHTMPQKTQIYMHSHMRTHGSTGANKQCHRRQDSSCIRLRRPHGATGGTHGSPVAPCSQDLRKICPLLIINYRYFLYNH